MHGDWEVEGSQVETDTEDAEGAEGAEDAEGAEGVESLAEMVERIGVALQLDEEVPIREAILLANELMGLRDEGPLPLQALHLLAAIGI